MSNKLREKNLMVNFEKQTTRASKQNLGSKTKQTRPSKQISSTKISLFEGSNVATNIYFLDSKVIFLVFRLVIVSLSNAQSNPSNIA
jgi:hypothetical protein